MLKAAVGAGALKRTQSLPANALSSSSSRSSAGSLHTPSPACSHCRVGRSADEPVVVCERCNEWSHAVCAGIGGLASESTYLCSRCCQYSTTEEDLSPDEPSDMKEFGIAPTAASMPASIANSPTAYSSNMTEYTSVGTIAPASLHDSEATYICPVCDIDCTCENKQQARRNSIYSGPVEIFDRPEKAAKANARKNSTGHFASASAPSPSGGGNGALKRARTMSSPRIDADDGKKEGSAASDKSPTKKEDRIIACTQEGCDKVYTTMAGLRYHLKTFDHQKNKRKDSVDGSGSAAVSAAPSAVASPTSSGPSPPSGTAPTAANGAPAATAAAASATAAAGTAAAGSATMIGGSGNGVALVTPLGAAAVSASTSGALSDAGVGSAGGLASDAMDVVGDGNGLRRGSNAADMGELDDRHTRAGSTASLPAQARRLSYFSESEDDSNEEDEDDDDVFSSHSSSVLTRRHSYAGHTSNTGASASSASRSGSSSRRSMLFEPTPFISSPIFYPTSFDTMQGPTAFSLDFPPLMASISGDVLEWDLS